MDYRWNWQIIPQYLLRFDADTARWVPGLITQGMLTTLRVSAYATLLAMCLGTMMGLLRVGRNLFNRLLGWGYVEFLRNIPILVWIFIFYFFFSHQIIPLLGLEETSALLGTHEQRNWLIKLLWVPPGRAPAFVSAVLALAIYEGAYITEIIRAGIESIEKGQWEAASALGFSKWQRMRYVIFPQALQRVLPPLAGQFISTIKDSAIVSVISIQELTFQGMELMAAAFLTFEVWIVIMGLYFLICLACSLAVARLETYYMRRRSA
jgi:polar amino acid transport system permease protein